MPKYLEGHYEADTSSEASDIESEEHFKHRMHGKPEPKNVEGPAEYRKGFASMDKDFVRKVGRKGGKHSHGSRGKLSEEEYQQELEEFSDEAGFGEGEEIEAYGGTGKQGFASMPKSKVRRIARKGGKIGGKHSHGFGPQYYDEEFLYPHPGYKGMDAPEHRRRKRSHKHEDTSSRKRSKTEEQSDLSEEEEEDTSHKGKQGFASMPKEKVRAIAAKGGRHSHGGKGKHYDEKEDDMSEEDTHTHRKSSGHGKQGFASMPKEKVRAIAAKGGRHSHGGKGKHYDEDEDESEGESRSQRKSISSGHHKQGFAAMPKEKLRAIASKGGRHSHGIYDEDDDDESEGEHTTQSRRRSSEHHGKQGFASMPKEKVRAIAAKGGRHSHGGKGKHYDDDDDDDMSEEDTHSRRKSSGSSHHGKQGFASMPKEQVRAIAAKGGRNSHKYSH